MLGEIFGMVKTIMGMFKNMTSLLVVVPVSCVLMLLPPPISCIALCCISPILIVSVIRFVKKFLPGPLKMLIPI